MSALLDTGALLAAIAQNDDLHDICTLALAEEPEPLLPYIVLPELAYLILRSSDLNIVTCLNCFLSFIPL